MPNPNEFLIFFRDRVGAVTAISAIVAAGGALIVYLGLTSIRRVMLSDEYKRITGIREPALAERLQLRLNQSGIRLKLGEFVAVGLLVGAVTGAILIGLGFVTIGLCAVPAGVAAYYQVLMARRAREYVAFAEQLQQRALSDQATLYGMALKVAARDAAAAAPAGAASAAAGAGPAGSGRLDPMLLM